MTEAPSTTQKRAKKDEEEDDDEGDEEDEDSNEEDSHCSDEDEESSKGKGEDVGLVLSLELEDKHNEDVFTPDRQADLSSKRPRTVSSASSPQAGRPVMCVSIACQKQTIGSFFLMF
jgi:hypothetical protein